MPTPSGILKGCRRSLLIILSERGIPLGAQHHAMLMDCIDHDPVLHGAQRALAVTCSADVFD